MYSRVSRTAANPPADWILVGERRPNERFVDDRDERSIPAIAIVEIAAAADRNTQRPEVVGSRDDEERLRGTNAQVVGTRTALEPVAAVRPDRRRQAGHRADSGDAWDRAQVREQLPIERGRAWRLLERSHGHRRAEYEHLPGDEPHFDGGQLHEASSEQSGREHEDDRQRDLGHDEYAARPGAAGTDRRSFPTLPQAVDQLDARDLQRRCEAEDEARHQRDRQREAQNGGVDPDFVEPRQVGRRQSHETKHAQPGEPHAADTSHERQQRALGEKLTDQSSAGRAYRRAHDHFTLASGRPCEQQVRDIGARDQQHEADGREQDVERLAGVADQEILQWQHHDGLCRVAVGILLFEALRDGRHLQLRLHDGDAGPQAANHAVVVRRSRGGRRHDPRGRINVRTRRIADSRLEHAHDREDTIVELDCRPDRCRITVELLAPERLGDHGRQRPCRLLLVGCKQSTGTRLRTKRLEESRRHAVDRRVVADAIQRDAHLAASEVRERLEALALRFPVMEVGRRNRHRSQARFRPQIRHRDDAIGVRIRQRPQHHRVDDAEHGRRGADPEREGQNGREREGGLSRKAARRIPKVLKELLHAALDGSRETRVARGSTPNSATHNASNGLPTPNLEVGS